MKRFSVLILLVAGLLYSVHARAQFLPIQLGPDQAPFFTNWKKIDTAHFRIIFPAQIEKDARKVADFMEYALPAIHKTAGAPVRHTTIILFSDLAMSNGIATLAPQRSEWYTTPMQSFYGQSTEWLKVLGIHEFRHMLQFDSLDRGTLGALRTIFGDEVYALAMFALAVPAWYFEGDATVTETVLSDSGRGRTPEFDAGFRAQLLSGKRFGYYKALMGSYYDYTPMTSPYLSGYYLVSKMRKDNGPGVFNFANKEASWLPIPYRYTHAIKSYTGKHTSDHYEEMLDELYALWSKQLEGFVESPALQLTKGDKKNWRSIRSCVETPIGLVGIRDSKEIVKINIETGREEVLVSTMTLDETLSSGGELIAWCEEIPHPRWGKQTYSDIYTYDVHKKRERRLTDRQKYFAPAVSPDGKKIVCVEFSNARKSSLVFIDSDSGNELYRYAPSNDDFLTNPRWSPDGKTVVFESLHPFKGNALYAIQSDATKPVRILDYSHNGVKNSATDGKYVYFTSSYSGIDAVYAVDIASGRRYQVIARRYGAYLSSISSDRKKLLFSDVTPDGFMAAESVIDEKSFIPIEKVQVRKVVYAEPLIEQESKKSIIVENIPENERTVQDYSGAEKIFSVHSWYPWYDSTSHTFTLNLYSTNMLTTFGSMLGYEYNYNEKTHAGAGSLSYAGMYPIFDISGIIGHRNISYTEKVDGKKTYKYDSWTEKTVEGAIRLPLNFSRGLWIRGIDFSGGMKYTHKDGIDYIPSSKSLKDNNGTFIPASYSMDFYNLTPEKGYVNPVFGQILSVKYSHTPLNTGDYKGSMLSGRAVLYLPGLLKRSNLFFEGTYEKQKVDVKKYIYASEFLFPRGYESVFHETFYKGSANYTLPLFYPDHNILWLFYLKRIYINGFYDHGIGFYNNEKYRYRSAGGELYFEIKPFNIMGDYGLHIGYQRAYLFDAAPGEKKQTWAVIVGFSSGYF
jgi:Tol biopolymer transport system component